jgi:hypothetical protein
VVQHEPISPELALVDPDLATRARAALPGALPARPHPAAPATPRAGAAEPASESRHARPYPLWARLTAALWLLVIGILIGGAAIPHAQDEPRLIPKQDEPPTVCTAPATPTAPQQRPATRFGFP